MTVINPNSISGITSITLPSGDGNVLTIHTNDGTERFRIDSSGNVKVGSACTISPDGDVFFTGVCTATTLAGSGANLTALPAANLTGALPAISGANLTGIAATDNVRTGILDVSGISTFRNTMNVGAAVTISESGIEATGVGITVANINGGQVGGRRNIVINGKALINQRGDSTGNTSSGYYGPDRFETTIYGGTYSHSAASSGSTLPEFPKCFRIWAQKHRCQSPVRTVVPRACCTRGSVRIVHSRLACAYHCSRTAWSCATKLHGHTHG